MTLPVPTSEESATIAEVIHWLANFDDDPWYALCRITPEVLLKASGLSRITFFRAYKMARNNFGGPVSPATAAALSPMIRGIESGEIVCVSRVHNRKETIRLQPPPRLPHPQPPLILAEDFQYWARCARCHGRRFAAITLSGDPYAACFDCVPPRIYGTILARPEPRMQPTLWEQQLRDERVAG